VAAKPIIFDSPQIISLPQYCVRCGESTLGAIVLKPMEARSLSGHLLETGLSIAFQPAHLAFGIALLSRPNAKIPMCGKCRWAHFLPNREMSAWTVFLLVSLGSAFYFGLREQFSVMLGGIMAAIIGLAMLAWRGRSKELKTLPVQVYYLKPGYRYVILGGPLHDFFSGQIQAQPPIKQAALI
jgi:hypothetical protein